jgi:hypothetical protein
MFKRKATLQRGRGRITRGSSKPTKPKNLADRELSDDDSKVREPISKKQKKAREPSGPPSDNEDLPTNWDEEGDGNAPDLDVSDVPLRQLTAIVMSYFVEDTDRSKLNQMSAAVHLIAKVTGVSLENVIWPSRFDEIAEDWDDSFPYKGHPLIGATFPRLEAYICGEMRRYFEKECKAYIKEKRKLGIKVSPDWKKAWKKLCRFLTLFRKAHLYLGPVR